MQNSVFAGRHTDIHTQIAHTIKPPNAMWKRTSWLFFHSETRKEYTQREKGIEDKETHAMCMHQHSKTPIYIAKTAI